ncbi:multidrug ABC transporter permease [Anopheles sinensis]|uniref:Multidrug ABC transporter permease n=1 Tax=Anopheles sinensis TaxID=74873 RepID=A0A084W956_ANOSI|nr:multidrug ABC transporter permease [Anopheles sinensis]
MVALLLKVLQRKASLVSIELPQVDPSAAGLYTSVRRDKLRPHLGTLNTAQCEQINRYSNHFQFFFFSEAACADAELGPVSVIVPSSTALARRLHSFVRTTNVALAIPPKPGPGVPTFSAPNRPSKVLPNSISRRITASHRFDLSLDFVRFGSHGTC